MRPHAVRILHSTLTHTCPPQTREPHTLPSRVRLQLLTCREAFNCPILSSVTCPLIAEGDPPALYIQPHLPPVQVPGACAARGCGRAYLMPLLRKWPKSSTLPKRKRMSAVEPRTLAETSAAASSGFSTMSSPTASSTAGRWKAAARPTMTTVTRVCVVLAL